MYSTKRRGRARVLASVLAITLVAAACGNGDDDAADPGTDNGEDVDLEGMTVNLMTPWTGDDEVGLLTALEPWEEETGATISHEGSGDFETLINTRVEGGNPPDIAVFPQPGLMADIHNSYGMRDLSDIIDVDDFQANVVDGMYDLGVVDGDFVGAVYKLSLKSMVWYNPDAFDEAGYEVPDTWDEMVDLTNQIREDGTSPWCVGIESGGATGWTATDWFEDIMLRTAGPDAYDQWAEGELPFDSDEVRRAGELFEELILTEGNALGGRDQIVTSHHSEVSANMFADPPACHLFRQASFAFSFFPDDVQDDLDNRAAFFPFPQIDEEHGTPALIAGDLASLFSEDNPAAESLMRFMASAEGAEGWAQFGGILSAHTDFDASLYPSEIDRQQQEFLAEASFARFDASDLMPAAVGAGSFWTQMTSWINGDTDLGSALSAIDQSWPANGGDADEPDDDETEEDEPEAEEPDDDETDDE